MVTSGFTNNGIDLEDCALAQQVRAPLNVVKACLGVVVHPVSTMGQIASSRPWVIALVVSLTVSLAGALANLAQVPALATLQATPPGASEWVVNVSVAATRFVALTHSPVWLVIAPATGLVLVTVWTAALYEIGRFVGGRGPFSAVFSTGAFASLPWILYAPLQVWLPVGSSLSDLVHHVFFLWELLLIVIGLRAAMTLSTLRAVSVLGVLFVVPGLLVGVVILVFLAPAIPVILGVLVAAIILARSAMRPATRGQRSSGRE